MSELEVVRIKNAAAVQLPSIRRLLKEAFETNSLVVNVDAAIDELDYWVIREDAGLFAVRENGSWVGMAFAQWGESHFAPHCTIIHVFNKGTRNALKALNRALVAYSKLGGYSRALTLDVNGKPGAFGVLFKEGGAAVPAGTAYYFNFDEGT